MDEPGEDCGLFGGVGAEGAFEFGVALGGGDDLRERDLEDAPPERVVVGVRAWTGVGDEPERELRLELEVLAVQEPGCDLVAAGELLDQSFGEALAVFDLDADDHAAAGESGDVVSDAGVAAALRGTSQSRPSRRIRRASL